MHNINNEVFKIVLFDLRAHQLFIFQMWFMAVQRIGDFIEKWDLHKPCRILRIWIESKVKEF